MKTDSGQILIGNTQNIGGYGLSAQIFKNIKKDNFVIFRFTYENTSIGGYGRVVWSGSDQEKNSFGITFLKMKQKDKSYLNEILECIVSPTCPVCHSKIDIDELMPYFDRKIQREKMDYGHTLPLMEIAYLLNSNLSWNTLMQKILEVIKNWFQAKAVRLFLYDKETGTLEPSHHIGFQFNEEFLYDFERSISREKCCENQIIFISDLQKNPSFISKNLAKTAWIRSIVTIPLIAEGKALGILSLYIPPPDQKEPLKKKEEELLLTFANLIAVGINAHFYRYKPTQ
jgi:putative methionine-R-sulfoxide reductase with GAF domain